MQQRGMEDPRIWDPSPCGLPGIELSVSGVILLKNKDQSRMDREAVCRESCISDPVLASSFLPIVRTLPEIICVGAIMIESRDRRSELSGP